VAAVKVIAGMLVLWSAGVGLGALGVWAGVSVRQGWRRRRTRLVAWGGRRGDVQVGTLEDVTRLCEQLIASANLKLLGIVSGLPVLELPGSGGWRSGPTKVDMVSARGSQTMDVYVVARSPGRVVKVKDE
jgi:hypothetical protein